MPVDQRSVTRKRLFRIGEIHIEGYSYPVDCLVRDTSNGGALIEVGHTDIVPETFRLTISSSGLDVPCRVIRRTAHMLGVAFVA
ncbi:PilZ domain-containing protein [Methylobacterium sp.]|uniref:PilZ domain-containing protein n=1 Tax=Methylobacterium sp. TaxID=409 RepID=UPI003454822B